MDAEQREIQARLEGYIEFGEIAGTVGAALGRASLFDWVSGRAGYRVGPRRYILTRQAGWVDLQHVVSACHSPGAAIGLSQLLGLVIEIYQGIQPRFRRSAFRKEDLYSNHIGGKAAWAKIFVDKSKAELVSDLILTLQPVDKADAIALLDSQQP